MVAKSLKVTIRSCDMLVPTTNVETDLLNSMLAKPHLSGLLKQFHIYLKVRVWKIILMDYREIACCGTTK